MDTHLLDNISPKNATRAAEILEVIVNELELQKLNRLKGNHIPWKYLLPYSQTTVLSVVNYFLNEEKGFQPVWGDNEKLVELYIKSKITLLPLAFNEEELLSSRFQQERNEALEKEIGEIIHYKTGTNLVLSINKRQLNLLREVVNLLRKKLADTDKGKRPTNTIKKLNNLKRKIKFSPDLYDEKTSVLKVFNQKIQVPQATNQDYLCRVIFLKFRDKLNDLDDVKNARLGQKVWSWDEITDMSEELIVSRSKVPDKEPWRPVYLAAKAVNNLIYKQTKIDDFFLQRPIKNVRINPKYLL